MKVSERKAADSGPCSSLGYELVKLSFHSVLGRFAQSSGFVETSPDVNGLDIAGVAVGLLFFVALIAVIIFIWMKRRKPDVDAWIQTEGTEFGFESEREFTNRFETEIDCHDVMDQPEHTASLALQWECGQAEETEFPAYTAINSSLAG
jgi:hypothetical protein